MAHGFAAHLWRTSRAIVLVAACGLPGRATAQDWPAAPITAFGGRVTIGGDVTATAGSDDPGYFNYTDYDRSALRLGRIDLVTTLQANRRISFLLELRAEGDLWQGHWSGSPYAAYVRVRPWLNRPVEIDAGRVPSAFGAFIQQSYGGSNPLIGYPLAYQYLTSLRSDSIPANADQLLAARARGWYVAYPVGSPVPENGVPLVSAFRYDTGARVHVGSARTRFEWFGSVTAGTLAYPLVRDDNGSPQFATRLMARPTIGLVLGVSAARGAFVADEVRSELPAALRERQYPQRALGADAEYSRDHWLVRAETVFSQWQLPPIEAPALDRLGAGSWMVEGRYTILPQLYAAARVDKLWFGEVQGTRERDTWDADVQRVEVGLGYRLARGVTLKTSVQHVKRDGGRTREDTLGALQVVLWF